MSRLFPALERTIQPARSAVLAHPEHQLLPIHRQTIYRALVRADVNTGSRARGFLAYLSANYVLPIWTSAGANDRIVEDTVTMAKAFWRGHETLAAAELQLGKAWIYLEQLATTPMGDTRAFLAGFAAVKALAETMDRDTFLDAIITDASTDRDLDPWSSDTALYAAGAFGGPVWGPVSDTSRRQLFWEWWLGTAIPVAWRTTEESP